FPWYGPRRCELPSWSWRKDKPLLFGEFTCVYGATPDNQAAIIEVAQGVFTRFAAVFASIPHAQTAKEPAHVL
ncbi:MAG TPA: hypothetical protein PLV04_10150, partial [Phenylobacterium sp.]|nr:hypothetical protein [Phenylobacterium sp.]